MVSKNPTSSHNPSYGMQSKPYGDPSDNISAHNLRDKATHSVREVSDFVKERSSDVSHQVQQKAVQAKEWFGHTAQDHPMIMAGAFVVLGVAAGLALPTTQPERRIMGNAGRRIVGQAQEFGSQLLDKGEELADKAVDSVRSSIKSSSGISEGGSGSRLSSNA